MQVGPSHEYSIDGVSKAVQIEKVENGFIVTIRHFGQPTGDPMTKMYKAMVTVLPMINKLGGKGMAEGVDEAVEPWKTQDVERQESSEAATEKAKAAVEEAFKDPPQKTVETHVFAKLEEMIAFVQKVLA